jgi:pimeloyl-ACP methyl ester carboxylesterase
MRRWVILGLAGAIAVGLLVNAFVTRRATAPASAGEGRVVVPLRGLPDLSVRVAGRLARPPLVLLHPYTLSAVDWARVIPRLTESHRLIAVDLVGHGYSEKPREGYALTKQADAVWAALRRLRVRCPLLVGHSLGGTVATAMAQRRPEAARGLVVIGSASRWRDIRLPFALRVATWPVVGELLYRTVPDGTLKDNLQDAFRPGSAVPDKFVATYRRMTYTSYRATGEAMRRFLEHAPVHTRLRHATLPVLAVMGSDDRIVSPDALANWAKIPTARTRLIPRGSHMLPWEEPSRIADLIRGFDRTSARECR